jgi:hypothetical protein
MERKETKRERSDIYDYALNTTTKGPLIGKFKTAWERETGGKPILIRHSNWRNWVTTRDPNLIPYNVYVYKLGTTKPPKLLVDVCGTEAKFSKKYEWIILINCVGNRAGQCFTQRTKSELLTEKAVSEPLTDEMKQAKTKILLKTIRTANYAIGEMRNKILKSNLGVSMVPFDVVFVCEKGQNRSVSTLMLHLLLNLSQNEFSESIRSELPYYDEEDPIKSLYPILAKVRPEAFKTTRLNDAVEYFKDEFNALDHRTVMSPRERSFVVDTFEEIARVLRARALLNDKWIGETNSWHELVEYAYEKGKKEIKQLEIELGKRKFGENFNDPGTQFVTTKFDQECRIV